MVLSILHASSQLAMTSEEGTWQAPFILREFVTFPEAIAMSVAVKI